MLVEADIRIVKFWLDISKTEQAERLDARRNDPLKALKVSDLDAVAQKKWKAYSKARDEMLIAHPHRLRALDHACTPTTRRRRGSPSCATCCTRWRPTRRRAQDV